MPLRITDLAPGDRVILNCPKSRVAQKREAQFEGIYHSLQDAMTGYDILLAGTSTAEFLESGGTLGWAAFLFQVSAEPLVRVRNPDGSPTYIPNPSGSMELRGAFVVEPDGSLREEEGRRIFIERRLGRVGVG